MIALFTVTWFVFVLIMAVLLVCVAFDRKGYYASKWWAVILTLVFITFFTWNDWTVRSIWDAMQSWVLWKHVGVYLAIGIAYCLPEFALGVRRAERYYANAWAKRNQHEAVTHFTTYTDAPYDAEYVRLQTVAGVPVPKVDKVQLAEYIGAWTVFWPFYLINLVLGDLITEVFRALGDFLVAISGRFVRAVFRNTFNVKQGQ